MRTPRRLVVALAFTALPLSPLLLAACEKNDKPKAEVTNAVTTASAKTAGVHEQLPLATGSKIEWIGAKVTKSHPGSFSGLVGNVDLVDADPEKSSVSLDVDLATVSTDDDQLAGHLKSKDFFDVAQFPKANFTSTSIKKQDGPNGANYSITGNLDFHGVKKSISFPAKVTVSPSAVAAKAEFVINRKDFNIVYPGMADDLIKDDVTIKFDISAERKKS
jgi:polyisoprenoid-binding protein YceI